MAVRLTLLPLLASAAVASADAPGASPTSPPGSSTSPAGDPTTQTVDPPTALDPGDPPESLPLGFDTALAPPGMTDPMLSPPGMTPPIDCEDDPDRDERPECTVSGGVIWGGFGHYFWVGGG